jgi:hypothetical protein
MFSSTSHKHLYKTYLIPFLKYVEVIYTWYVYD